ncbi:hypothetical protein [Roseimaritima multifibrata]|nr:hypothetical protein [Roseimaritima multifibrata]
MQFPENIFSFDSGNREEKQQAINDNKGSAIDWRRIIDFRIGSDRVV